MTVFNHVVDDFSRDILIDKINSMEYPKNVFIEDCEQEFTGSWSMLKLWRKWMDETAKFMAGNGVVMPHYIDKDGNHHGKRSFKADDAHELFTARWMGVDGNGSRYSWALRSTDKNIKPAPKGKRLYAMEKHLNWATEKGLKLTNPEDSEFRKVSMETEK